MGCFFRKLRGKNYWLRIWGCGQGPTIMGKAFEANSSFRVGWSVPAVPFLLLLAGASLRGGGWALGNNSMRFWDFSDISCFPKILSLKLFGNSTGYSYIPCLLLIITLRFTCGEAKIFATIKKSQNDMNMMIVAW